MDTKPAQHTSGEWAWEEGQGGICAPNWDGHRVEVAQVNSGFPYHEDSGKASEEAGANARRIVRAVNCHDELVAACMAAHAAVEFAVQKGDNPLDAALLEMLGATLVKAEGSPA